MPNFDYNQLTTEQQTKASDVYKTLLKFKEFQNKASLPLFKYLFKERGEHLFVEVFVQKSNRNIIEFFNRVGVDVQSVITTNVLFNETMYAHDFLYDEKK